MKMFHARVRPHGGAQVIDLDVMAMTAQEAKLLLEMEFGEGNVLHYPREIV